MSIHGPPQLYIEPPKLMNFNFNADPDPAFHCNLVPHPGPDPASDNNPQPCSFYCELLSIKCLHRRVNERLEVPGNGGKNADHQEEEGTEASRFERRLPFVTSVTRKEADDWLAKCRRDLDVPAADTSLVEIDNP